MTNAAWRFRMYDAERLTFPSYVAATIAHFVSFEVRNFVEMIGWIRSVAGMRHGALVSVVRMEVVVHVAAKVG